MSDVEPLLTIGQVVERARSRLDPGVWSWAAAGAGEGRTLARNGEALERLALVPRILRDVSHVDMSTSVLDIPIAIPVLLAPVGALGIYDSGDALVAAEAAAGIGTSAFCAMLTESAWEDVAATAPDRQFLQLFVHGDRAWVSEILSRAEAARFAGICVTADSPVIGRRDESIESDFTWTVPPEGAANLRRHGNDLAYRRKLTWPDIEWLCSATRLPVILKGVMTPDDAAMAVDVGVRAVYVSNHGGRVVDHSVGTMEVLAEIAESVPDSIDVIIDGGFSRGAHLCKALALGARAVGIGRLQCWALAAGGVVALTRTLEILREELANTMANLGCAAIDELTPDRVRHRPPSM